MSDPGTATQADPPGLVKYRALMTGGATQQQAEDWKARVSLTLARGGASRDVIDGYFGDKQSAPELAQLMARNADSPHEAQNPYEEFMGGWQHSVAGIVQTGGKPTLAHSPKSSIFGEVANSVGQFAGDLPAAVPGAFIGGGAGTAAGAAIPVGGETGVTEAVGGAAGAGFGFNAAPQGVREALLVAYNHGQIHNAHDAWNVATAAALRTVKAGTVGAVTNLVGGPAARLAAKVGLGGVAQTITRLGAETGAAATTGAVLEGHLPDSHDFTAAALLVFGLHGAARAAGRVVNGKYAPSVPEQRIALALQNVYRETGVPPWEAGRLAKDDPVLYQELLGQDPQGNPSTVKFKTKAGVEPTPYPKGAAKTGVEGEGAKVATTDDLLPFVRKLEGSGDAAISPAGAIGRYQIMPGTARQYGFDPARLTDPEYNETVGRTVLNDLTHRYNGDTAAVLVAYNAGPKWAGKFLAVGRDPSILPKETQKYLNHAESLGLTSVGPFRPNWRAFKDTPGRVLRANEDGSLTPDPHAVASYLQEFGRLAGFRFAVSPGETEASGGGAFVTGKEGSSLEGLRAVHMPDTPDEATKRWYGLGRYEVLYHEVGHAIDSHILGSNRSIDSPELRAELTESSKQWKPVIWETNPRHAAKDDELMADGIARWLSDPTARKSMPLFTTALGEQLQPYADIAAKAMPTRDGNGEWKEPPGSPSGGGWYGMGGVGGKPPGGTPPSEGGEGPKKLPPPDRINLNFDTRAERFQEDMVGAEKERPYGLGDAVRQFVSELKPAEDIDKVLREQGRLGPKDVGVADMFRQTYGSEGRAISMLRDGPLDLSDPNAIARREGIKPYMQVLKDVRDGGGTLEGFDYWRNAQRTAQLDKRGIKGTMPLEEAQRTLKDAPKIYQQADKDLQKFQRAVLEYGRDSGIFSQKQIDAMQKAGPSYVSFRRVMGDDKSFSLTRGGRSFKVGRAVFKIEGSDRQILSPLLTDIDNVRLITRMADRNRAQRSAIGPLSHPTEGLPALIKKERVIEIAEPGSDVFKPYNLDAQGEKAFVPMTAVKAESGDKNTFVHYEDGKPTLYRAEHEDLAALMRGADSVPEANILDRTFTMASKLTRLGVVLAPDFPIRVGLRHEMTAYVYDPLHPPPIMNFVQGSMDIIGKEDAFKDWQANGGAGATFAEMGESSLKYDLFKLFDQTGFTSKGWNIVRHPLMAGMMYSEFFQSANRVGYTIRAKNMGYEPLKAATMSRTAYLDYSERGTAAFMNMWSKWVPFLRAHILGTEMLVKAYASNPVGTVARLTLSHTIPSVALYVLNYFQDKSDSIPEDQRYENIPRWEKDTFYILPQIDGVRIRIPYGFQSGAIGGGLIQRFLDSEYKKDPRAFDGFARSFANEFIPPLMPDLLRPPAEIASNQNFFTGQPLIPDSQKDAAGPYQFTDGTSEPAKALSKFLSPIVNVSPIHIDELVRGWAGTLGQDALRAADTTMGHPGMPWEVADIPFVQSFVVRNRGATPQVIEDFYTDLQKVKEQDANFSLSRKRGDEGAMLGNAKGRAYAKLDDIAKAIAVQRNLIRGINTNDKMSTDEKRQSIDAAYQLMIFEAKQGSQAIRSMGAQ